MLIVLFNTVSKYEQVEAEIESINESHSIETIETQIAIPSTKSNTLSQNLNKEINDTVHPEFMHSKDWDSDDSYLLAKIAMAEAEGCSTQTKVMVIFTVLNRVWSDEFPNSIKEVIFQEYNGVYQFSPIGSGRWDKVEPNDDCWEAVRIVMESKYDYSNNALYFESCEDSDNWHSRNLEFLYESDGLRFYK